MLKGLKRILKADPHRSLKEVMKFIEELLRMDYSGNQVRRILVEKLGMNYVKPFAHGCKRPKNAGDIFLKGKMLKNYVSLRWGCINGN